MGEPQNGRPPRVGVPGMDGGEPPPLWAANGSEEPATDPGVVARAVPNRVSPTATRPHQGGGAPIGWTIGNTSRAFAVADSVNPVALQSGAGSAKPEIPSEEGTPRSRARRLNSRARSPSGVSVVRISSTLRWQTC